MVLSEIFLSPLGLAAFALAIPIVVLYFIRPEPQRMELPTFRFLANDERQQATNPLLERLSRSLLLLVQLLALLLLAVGLAAPYVMVNERAVVEETVLVVDTSASMATTGGGDTRLARALETADAEVTSTTSVVTTDDGGDVTLQRGTPSEAREALGQLQVTDAPGDLDGAITQATALAGENARIVVLSDFAGNEWTDAVATARARDLSVDLRQFDAGGDANVGFVDRRFAGSRVTLSVKNFGSETVTRTVTLGNRNARVELGPDDLETVTFPVPAGRSQARLSPGDGFATDDTVSIAAPSDPTVEVLVLTNDPNRYLITALEVVDQVDVTVDRPPTTVTDDYDVIVYSNVDPSALLPGNVEAGRELVADGGGVVVQAQPELPTRYGDLLLLEPGPVRSAATVQSPPPDELTRGIDFQPPDEYVSGSLREGRTVVELGDGTPLIATAERESGRLLYYGYIEDSSSFKFNYQYPVFWKRAVFHLANRDPLPALNFETGETVRFDADRIEGPDGPVTGPTNSLQRVGFYSAAGRTVSASLLDERESDTAVEPLSDRQGPTGNATREERRSVPRPLTEFAALAGLFVVLLEVGYLRYRGDL
ncbi:BatA domain-containing protein [Halomicroarcula sp. GCM10025324]|uniref:vWA domain-containing protein n=1 Tax=Haloarcula TaxID=2237 RepID=UPI0023E76C43|nr:BatA and WFA domain-containing protein [Halomicroarcula sp. ZS-22-S1]